MADGRLHDGSWDPAARYATLAAAALGALVLAGWVTGTEILTTFGSGLIPMAPSTAALFILFGVTAAVAAAGTRYPRRVRAVVGLGTLLAALLLVTSSLGYTSSLEHPGLRIHGVVGGAPVGHMSPFTALAFVLAGSSLLSGLGLPDGRLQSPRAAFLMALALELLAGVLVSAYVMTQPLLYGTGTIPPALPTSLGFLILGAGLILRSGHALWPQSDAEVRFRRGHLLLAILFVAGAAIITAGALLFRRYENDVRHEVEEQLGAIADLKVAQLENWRMERMADAASMADNPMFAGLLARVRSAPGDEAARTDLRRWLESFAVSHRSPRVSLHDPQGQTLMAAPTDADTLAPHDPEDIRRVIAGGAVEFSGFHRDSESGPMHLTVVAPVFDSSGVALGAVATRVNPEIYLFPALQIWPSRNRTAETLIVRRDGDDVLFLSPLRFRDDPPGTFRLPLDDGSLPAAVALRGTEGIVEGVDYRGEPVIAAIRMVEGSPWRLVARIDRAEVFAPIRARLRTTVGFIAFLLLGVTAAVGLGWQRREKLHYRSLAAREEKYRSLFNSIRDAILVTNRKREIIDGNPAFTDLFGYDLEEVAGHEVRVVYESDQEFDALTRELRADLTQNVYSARYQRKDGSVFAGETTVFPLRDTEGRTAGFIGVIRDLSERERAAEALARSERRYRTLYEDAPVGIFRTRSDGHALAINRAMAQILGFDSEAPAVRHYQDLGHQLYADPERRREFLTRLQTEGYIEAFEYRAVRPDGTEIWIEMNARVARTNPDGTFDIEGFAADITARKRATLELERQRTMLQRTEQIARIGSWELDVATGSVAWSDELFAIFGVDPEDGAPPLGESGGLFPPEEAQRLRAAVELAIDEGEPYDMELEAVRPDGEVRFCRARGYPERAPDGSVMRLYGTLSDTTEERLREERETGLRAQLAQAQKMESVGRLAGGVAHDFNNMLSVIMGHTELAIGQVDDNDELRSELRAVYAAAERSTDLTRQLLAFAREQIVVPKVLDLNQTVESMLKMLQRVIGEDIALDWEPSESIWPVRIDPTQVDQVLVNLMVNARDAIEGVGTVTIRTERAMIDRAYVAANPEAAVGEFVCLVVSDTGCGMESGVAERIFEPFFSTKPEGEGTGLGLSTVYGIVRQNEGHINVYSEPGEGTTFRIYLPRSYAEAEARESSAESVTPKGGSETVLVVEDQPALLRLTRKILTGLGYTVLTAAAPREAMAVATSHPDPIQLLLTDVVMPEMNGRDLAERLQAERPELRVLFMSGYPADVIADRGVIREGVRFIEKPFTVSQLGREVRATLDTERSKQG